MLEGDLVIPRTRNAMKCLHKPYNCRWPKSANGNVEVPYVLSSKYGRFLLLKIMHISFKKSESVMILMNYLHF